MIKYNISYKNDTFFTTGRKLIIAAFLDCLFIYVKYRQCSKLVKAAPFPSQYPQIGAFMPPAIPIGRAPANPHCSVLDEIISKNPSCVTVFILKF
jgi:hypothetical protein